MSHSRRDKEIRKWLATVVVLVGVWAMLKLVADHTMVDYHFVHEGIEVTLKCDGNPGEAGVAAAPVASIVSLETNIRLRIGASIVSTGSMVTITRRLILPGGIGTPYYGRQMRWYVHPRPFYRTTKLDIDGRTCLPLASTRGCVVSSGALRVTMKTKVVGHCYMDDTVSRVSDMEFAQAFCELVWPAFHYDGGWISK